MANHCPTCQRSLDADPGYACPACRTPYHVECFRAGRCVVPGCSSAAVPRTTGSALGFSWHWTWVTKVNLVVVAVFIASLIRQDETHLIPEQPVNVLAFFLALASAFGTFKAVREDLTEHVPAGRETRPDHHGSRAWIVYMGMTLTLYVALLCVWIPVVGILFAMFAMAVWMPAFGVAWLIGAWGVYADERKTRALLAVVFPVVATVMAGRSMNMLIGDGRTKANTRACYANQKTIVGAIEMYNLDYQGKRPKIESLDTATFDALKSGGYLQSVPDDPGRGRNTSNHYQTTSSGNGIKCTLHGSIQ